MFLHELKAYRKSTIIWTCSLVVVTVLFLLMYPNFSKNEVAVRKLLEGYPEAVRKAAGISIDSFFSILGFYSYIFIYIVLCGAIQAMNLGVSIVSKEARQKTADFLLTKPVTREQIITSKILAALTLLVITNIVYLIVATFMISVIKIEPFDMKIFIMISITLFFVQLIFMSLGIIISVAFPKIKSVIAVSLGTVFGFFIINMFDSVIGDKVLRYITPFKYFDAAYIIKHGTYEMSYVIVEIVVIIVAITVSYLIYAKKDVHAV